jgi:hypothetical protein
MVQMFNPAKSLQLVSEHLLEESKGRNWVRRQDNAHLEQYTNRGGANSVPEFFATGPSCIAYAAKSSHLLKNFSPDTEIPVSTPPY